MDTLISNVTIVTMNERMDVLVGGHVGITDGKIVHVAKVPPKEQPAEIIDGTGMVLMPGLVNCHTHLATTLLRSYCDELSLTQALEIQLQKEAHMDSRCAKSAAVLGVAECLRFGITSVSDLYYYPEATAEVIADSGMKANLSLSAYRFIDQCEEFDFHTDEQSTELRRVVEKWHGYDNGRIKIDSGIYAEYTSNYPLWEGLADFAAENGLGFQLHLAQSQEEADSCLDRTGLSQTELLSCHRVLDVPVTAAGCNALSEMDRKILGKHKATAVVLPMADAKQGRSCAPITECVQAGMNVALGSDGAVEAGNVDLFEVMRAAAMSVRASQGKADALPAQAALMMATVCGARAQGRAQECGMIKEGMDADLVLVDFSAPHLMPCHNVMNALVFSAKGGDVAMTMVRGKKLYVNGRFPTLDIAAAVQDITEYAMGKLFDEPHKN